MADRGKIRTRLRQDEDFDEEAHSNGCHQQEDNRFDGPHAKTLETKKEQHVQAGDDHTPEQRDMEKEVERHSASQNFGEFAGTDGDFGKKPVRDARPVRVPIATTLREIFSRNDTQSGRDHLHEDRHEARQSEHPEEAISELRTTLEIGSPVSRVHVSHAYKERRANKRPPLFPEPGETVRQFNRTVQPFEGKVNGVGHNLGGCLFGILLS